MYVNFNKINIHPLITIADQTYIVKNPYCENPYKLAYKLYDQMNPYRTGFQLNIS